MGRAQAMIAPPRRKGAYDRRPPKKEEFTRWEPWEFNLAMIQAKKFLPKYSDLSRAREVAKKLFMEED